MLTRIVQGTCSAILRFSVPTSAWSASPTQIAGKAYTVTRAPVEQRDLLELHAMRIMSANPEVVREILLVRGTVHVPKTSTASMVKAATRIFSLQTNASMVGNLSLLRLRSLGALSVSQHKKKEHGSQRNALKLLSFLPCSLVIYPSEMKRTVISSPRQRDRSLKIDTLLNTAKIMGIHRAKNRGQFGNTSHLTKLRK